jgi:hypothetical protein
MKKDNLGDKSRNYFDVGNIVNPCNLSFGNYSILTIEGREFICLSSLIPEIEAGFVLGNINLMSARGELYKRKKIRGEWVVTQNQDNYYAYLLDQRHLILNEEKVVLEGIVLKEVLMFCDIGNILFDNENPQFDLVKNNPKKAGVYDNPERGTLYQVLDNKNNKRLCGITDLMSFLERYNPRSYKILEE